MQQNTIRPLQIRETSPQADALFDPFCPEREHIARFVVACRTPACPHPATTPRGYCVPCEQDANAARMFEEATALINRPLHVSDIAVGIFLPLTLFGTASSLRLFFLLGCLFCASALWQRAVDHAWQRRNGRPVGGRHTSGRIICVVQADRRRR